MSRAFTVHGFPDCGLDLLARTRLFETNTQQCVWVVLIEMHLSPLAALLGGAVVETQIRVLDFAV